jgi:penicillin amidase
MRRLILKALVLALGLAAVVVVVAYLYARRSLPAIDGSVAVAGLAAPVEIVRDADAIPHIFASTKLDALYGLGYAHAQDRLWQMEFQRRIGHGRLSEIFGAATLPQDRFLRTVGFGRAARAAWATLPEAARQQIDAYVAGVNAFLVTHHGSELPPEFTLLRFEPVQWTGADVLVWVKMMAWDLSRNYSLELLRHEIVSVVGAERMTQLMPPYPSEGLSILSARDMTWANLLPPACPAHSTLPAPPAHPAPLWSGALARSLSTGHPAVGEFLLGSATSDALGSNNWVVDGTLSASGKPLLANDPHLGAQVPSLWYLAHISAGEVDVIGATLPGAPAVAIGRNRFIAWGETNVAADVEDLFRERLDPTGRFAEFRGAQEPLQLITETIHVKGAASVQLQVRLTRHGPLVSDAINANNAEIPREPRAAVLEPLAFRWTALDPQDTTIVSFLGLNEARNWDDFKAALRDFVVPSQNFVYADVNGHIGYYAPGRIPVRAHGDGSSPADGWSGEAEWTGWVPFEELPHTYDPPEHFIVTSNNRPAPPPYPHLLGLEWTEPYRAQRITDLLRRKGKLTPSDFAAIQADTFSPHADALLPLLLERVHQQSASDEQAIGILRGWNRDARGDSGAAALFQAWLLRLTPAIAGDELGPLVTADYMGLERSSFGARFLGRTLASPDSPWCDDVRTPARETCDDTVLTALHAAVGDLARQLGGDMTRWRWDAVHRAVFPHQGLDAVRLLRPLLSRSIPHGGDWSTVDVGPVIANRPYDQRSIASYRQIVDLSPANDSRFLAALGESGHPLSKHYDDFLADWAAVRHRPMRMDRKDVEAGALGHLHLLPVGGEGR